MFGDTVTWTGIPRVFTGPNMGDGAGQSFGTFTNSEGVAFASIIASFSPYPSDAIQYSAEFWPLWQDFFLADPSSCPTPGAPTCLYNNVAYAEAAADALFKPLGEGGIGLLYTSINIDPAPWFMASQYSSYCHAYSSDTVSLGTACFKPPTSPTNYQAILTRALGTYTEVLNYIQSAYPQVQIHFSPVPSISLWNTCKLTTAASRTEAAVEACFGPLYQTMVANVATARVTALHEPAGAWALFCGACPFLSSPANVDTFLQNASTAIKTVSPSTKVGAGGAYPDMGISGGVYTCPNTGGSLNYWCDYTTVDASFLDYVGMDLYPATNTSASYAALVGTPSGGMSGGLAATYTSMAQAAQAAHLPIYINESSALRWSFPGTGPGTTPGAESDTYLGSGWSGWTVTNAWSDWLAAVPVAWAEYMGIVGWDYIDTPALTCQSTDPNNTHTCPDCTQTQTGTPLPDTFMPTCMASLPSVSTYGTMYGTLASRNPFAAQTVAFGPLSDQPFGTAPFPVGATASSGLAVSFASITPAVCTISGATVTLVAAGTCAIRATQAGNTIYAAAPPVYQSFHVTQGSQTIAFGALSDQPFGTAPFPVSATATSGLAVSFASTTPACTVSGATVTLVSAGTCTIQATQAGNANYAAATPVSQSFQVTAASQTIAFGALANQPYGSAPFPVGATASSGLAVSFASTTRAVCTVSGATVTLAAGGTCTIQATQAGNANYAAATPVNQTFQVTPASQTITFGVLANQPLGTSPFPVSATASSGLAVSFASTTPSVCTVSSATVTLVAAGTCTIQARQAGNANYAAATPVNQSFQVQRSQTITFGALSNRAFGSAPFTVSATASSGLAVSFASTTSAVCTTSGATVTLAAAGTCTIQATQAGNTNYAAATPVNQSFQVTQASQTITFGALSNRAFGSAPFTVSATASSGLAVSFASTTSAVCTTSGATVTLVAAGTCTIQATQAGNANYAAATPVNRSFQVTPKSQTIAFGALSNRAFGSAPFTVSATASSGLAVSFASTTSAVCTTSGATVTLVAAGTCTIQATQAGNANWTAATPVNQSFQVTPASQTITFGALSKRAFGSAPFTVSATASSGLAVSFDSTTPAVCWGSGATVTLAAAGTCTIQATQAGNANYAAATPVSQSFQVTPASQTITFGALSNRAFGSAPFAVAATASSGLAVSFNSQTTKVCGVSGTTVTLLATGACTIQATQAGNANWAAATPVNQSFQVTQGSQTITFGALSNQTLGTPPFTVSATASSGFAVSFASATTAVCTVSGSTVTLVAAGTCTIKATQPGNANWAAATPVNQSFQVK
jgi:hypothetical protein